MISKRSGNTPFFFSTFCCAPAPKQSVGVNSSNNSSSGEPTDSSNSEEGEPYSIIRGAVVPRGCGKSSLLVFSLSSHCLAQIAHIHQKCMAEWGTLSPRFLDGVSKKGNPENWKD